MSNPRVLFSQTVDSEIRRLLFIANQVSLGFYKDKGIAVLSEKYIESAEKLTIYFPEFDYKQIPDFWERVKDTNQNMTFDSNPLLIEDLTRLIGNRIRIEEEKVLSIKDKWEKVQNEFWSIIRVIFPDNTEKLETVTINVSQYGSRASYKKFEDGDTSILIYIRDDADISHIAWAILSSLLSKNLGIIIHSWEEIMSCVDMLMTQTELHALFPHFSPGLTAIKATPSHLLLESQSYLESLGITFEKKFKLLNDELYFKGQLLNSELSINQIKILKLMFNLEGHVVSAYEIGDELWSDSEEFSLWAVNKTMQRLRSKLISLGASPLTLKSVRGKGYILNTNI
jgi:hypothetical protein